MAELIIGVANIKGAVKTWRGGGETQLNLRETKQFCAIKISLTVQCLHCIYFLISFFQLIPKSDVEISLIPNNKRFMCAP